MSGQGSGGNVLAALASFFIPGLGQLLQGRFAYGNNSFLFSGSSMDNSIRMDHSLMVNY